MKMLDITVKTIVRSLFSKGSKMLSEFLPRFQLRYSESPQKGVSLILISIFLFSCPGCSIFKGATRESDNSSVAFSEDKTEDESDSFFETERKKQKELAEMVANTGSQNKKRKVRRGDDFLLSDKAKEIYANTER